MTQKQIKSQNRTMTIEDVEEDVILAFSNKRDSILGLYISFPWGYKGKKNMNYYYESLGMIPPLPEKQLMSY